MKRGMTLKAIFALLAIVVSGSFSSAQSGTLRLTLDDALRIAMDENLSVKIADEEIARVNWLRKENWYMLLPSATGSAQYTNNILKPVFYSDFFPGGKMEVGSTHSYAVTGTVQVPLVSLAIFKSIQLSEIDMMAALESARSTKIELIMQVKNSFYGILMLEESLDVLNQSYKNAKETAENIKNMYENGLAAEYDMLRSDVAVRNILPMITQAENGLELSKMQLKVLLSLDIDAPIELVGEISSYRSQIESSLISDSFDLSENSDVRSLDIQIEKMNKNFELIRSQRLPSLAGFANYQLQTQSQEFTFKTAWANSFAVGLAVQVPIFNKLSISMKEKQVKIGLNQLQYQKELLNSNLNLAVTNTLNEMTKNKKQMVSDEEAVMLAEKSYEIAKTRYSAGIGILLELNDAEMALTNSKLNLNQTIYNYIKAQNEYEKVLGQENIN
jgi:Outer membrane protein